jgi:hypothetical protein
MKTKTVPPNVFAICLNYSDISKTGEVLTPEVIR